MKNKKLVRFAHSLVLLPMITSSLSFGGMQNLENNQNALVQKITAEAEGSFAQKEATVSEEEVLKAKAEAIDSYFRQRGMPLAGHGKGLVVAAEKYGLDYRLLAAIATRETTGGLAACPVTYKRTGDMGYKYNVFGWGSCKIKFKSYEDGFEVLARNLSGNNPNTAHYYEDKNTTEILRAYNPPSIVPRYAEEVISIMNTIGHKDIHLILAVNS